MKELKNIFISCKLVISSFPSFVIIKLIQTIISVVKALVPVYVIERIVNIYYEDADIYQIIVLCGISFLILAMLTVVNFCLELYENYINRMFTAKQSIIFFRKLNEIDYSFHDSPEFLNDYTRSLEESVEHIYTTCDASLNIIKILITSIGMFAVIASVHYIVIIFACILAIFYALLRFYMGKLQFKASTKQRPYRRLARYNERAFTLKESMAELKTTDVEKLLIEQNSKAYDEIIKIHQKYIFPKTIISFVSNIILTLLYPAIICLLAYFTIDNLDNATIATFSSLTVAATTISGLITQLTTAFGNVQSASVEVSVAFDLLKLKGKIEGVKGKAIGSFNSLSINHLSFAYDDKEVLSDVSIKINKGETIAIVGHNGAGKTTLVKLLLRFYDANSGNIVINGLDYKEVDVKSLRKEVGAVFQNVEVYAVSIAENILLRTPKTKADYQLIDEAIQFAGLSEFIASLKNGIDTIVTKEFDPNGVVFSGGLNQRLALARGYAHNYNLFILDEPSSALDPIAEAKVYENMMKLKKDKTIIFISHRLTSTVNADHIYLFENGRIIEAGTHQELMKLNQKYALMFTSQAKKYLGGEVDE